MDAGELLQKWRRVTSPRVRDAWLDREICGQEVAWERGRPVRVVRDGSGPSRHEPVPRWSTNLACARRLGRLVHPRPRLGGEPPEEACFKMLLRHYETKDGLWRWIAGAEIPPSRE